MKNVKNLLGIVLAALVILNIFTYSKLQGRLRDLEVRLDSINMQISSGMSQISGQVGSISGIVNSMKEEQRWVDNINYSLLDMDGGTGNIKVAVTWSFRDLAQGAKVYLTYGEKMDKSNEVKDWAMVECSSENLNYKAEVSLSPKKNYKFRVQAEGAGQVRNEEILDLELAGQIENRLSVIPTFMERENGPRYQHHAMVINNHMGMDLLRIKSATARVYVEGSLVSTVELHRAQASELSEDMEMKFDVRDNSEVWLNDEAVWVPGEEHWVKVNENSWTYKHDGKRPPEMNDVRIEVTITDNMGITYNKEFPFY